MTSEKAAQPTLETILRPGQTVAGKYCVDHLIASGGMAAVWAGINLRTGKRVALKVILRSFAATPGAEELFRREALAASRVNHPNVVTVFDVVDHASRTCIVMEYLDGEDLGAYFQRHGILSLEDAVALLLPAMRGVAAANAQGVVHRDLKPKNIFLCIGPDGRLITTKILDFGISVMAEKASEPRSQTVQLTTHGTPSYMSPEHITGAPNIDERADVYGFGVILFEALAGQAPFVGPTGTDLLMRILQEPAPKLTLFRPDLSPELDAIMQKALAKSPDDRYPTLNHFIVALEEHALPRSPILRSLTPVVGVPIIDPGSGSRALADPVVRVIRRPPSAEHDDGVTKGLYTLSRPVPPKRKETPPQPLPASRIPDAVLRPSEQQDTNLPLVRRSPSPDVSQARPQPQGRPAPLPPATPLPGPSQTPSRQGDTVLLASAAHKRKTILSLLIVAAVVGLVSVVVAWSVIPSSAHKPERVRPEHPTTPAAAAAPAQVASPEPAGQIAPGIASPSLDDKAPSATAQEVPDPALKRTADSAGAEPAGQAASGPARPETRSRSGRAPAHAPAKWASDDLAKPTQLGSEEAAARMNPPWPSNAIEPPPTPAAGETPSMPPSSIPSPQEKGTHRAGSLSPDDF
jgi:serine/threonine-protein kinase